MSDTGITPDVGSLQMRIYQQLVLPLVGVLTLNGPGGSLDTGVAQNIGGLSLSGLPPALAGGLVIPQAGSVTPAGRGPVMNWGLTDGSATVGLTGAIPGFGSGAGPAIGSGVLSATGAAPLLAVGFTTPDAGAMISVGAAPVIAVPNVGYTPSVGALQLTGLPPSRARAIQSIPGVLNLGGNLPANHSTIVMGGATTSALILSAAAPRVGSLLTPSPGLVLVTTVGVLSPTLQPSAVNLALSGAAPTFLQSSPVITASTASVAISGLNVSLTLRVPSAPAADLVWSGQSPLLIATDLLAPSTQSLQLTGAAPGQGANAAVVTTSGAMHWTTAPPAITRTLNGSAGAVNWAGMRPGVSANTFLTPASGLTGFAGLLPGLTPGVSSSPISGADYFGGNVPTLILASVTGMGALQLVGAPGALNLGLTPSGIALGMAGAVPTVNGQITLAVPSGTLGLSGAPPAQHYLTTPTAGGLSFQGMLVGVGGALIPRAGIVSVASSAPTVSSSGLPLTLTGTTVVQGLSPLLAGGIAPAVAQLNPLGQIPVVNSLTTIVVAPGAALLGSDPSALAQVGVLVPDAGAIGLASDAPSQLRTGYAAPPPAMLALMPSLPLVYSTTAGYCKPGPARLVYVGQPAVIPLYQPDMYHVVEVPGTSYVVQIAG